MSAMKNAHTCSLTWLTGTESYEWKNNWNRAIIAGINHNCTLVFLFRILLFFADPTNPSHADLKRPSTFQVHPHRCFHLICQITPFSLTVWVCTDLVWLTAPSLTCFVAPVLVKSTFTADILTYHSTESVCVLITLMKAAFLFSVEHTALVLRVLAHWHSLLGLSKTKCA